MNRANKILAFSILLSLVLVMLAALGARQLVGLQLTPLEGGSMQPTLQSGALLAMVKADPTQIHKGDIIGFNVPAIDTLVCHRVIGDVQTNSGKAYFTQGDGNPAPDDWVVYPQDITGKFWKDVSFLLPAIHFGDSPAGFLVLKIVPFLALGIVAIRALRLDLRKRRAGISALG